MDKGGWLNGEDAWMLAGFGESWLLALNSLQ